MKKKKSSIEKKESNTLRTKSTEISSATDPYTMKNPFPSGYVSKRCVQQVSLTYAQSKDELAKSTYNIAVWFWMLFTKKLKNVDKGILEGISRI